MSPTQDRLSLEAMVAKASNVASNLVNFDKQQQQPNQQSQHPNMRRSTSMSTQPPVETNIPPPPAPNNPQLMDREQFLRRSLTLTSRADRHNLINSLTERITQRMQQNGGYSKVSTHHVIPVNGGPPQQPTTTKPNHQNPNNQNKQLNNKEKVMSPEGEIYGFGAKFKENSQQYFDMSASYPSGGGGNSRRIEEVENQKFLDALSSKLLGKPPATTLNWYDNDFK